MYDRSTGPQIAPTTPARRTRGSRSGRTCCDNYIASDNSKRPLPRETPLVPRTRDDLSAWLTSASWTTPPRLTRGPPGNRMSPPHGLFATAPVCTTGGTTRGNAGMSPLWGRTHLENQRHQLILDLRERNAPKTQLFAPSSTSTRTRRAGRCYVLPPPDLWVPRSKTVNDAAPESRLCCG